MNLLYSRISKDVSVLVVNLVAIILQKNLSMKIRHAFTVIIMLLYGTLWSQSLNDLIPNSTVTHIATANGDWNSPGIWDTGTVPYFGSIVYIPENIEVTYSSVDSTHIFAIKNEGKLTIEENSASDTTILFVDTYIGMVNSITHILSSTNHDKKIQITFKPFDIESHVDTSSTWNQDAKNHFSDGAVVRKVERELIGDRRYNTYQEAIAGDNYVQTGDTTIIEDGFGVLGRYGWDPQQLTLGFVSMGQVVIDGYEKTAKVKLGADAAKGQKNVTLSSAPSGWFVGDTLLVTMDGNVGTASRGNDAKAIATINGANITTVKNLNKNHLGTPNDTLHCYAGNLTRNIEFKSFNPSLTNRAHFMIMHNDSMIQIKNALFRDMGRTNKSELLDDFRWKQWLEPPTFKSKISALGQECVELENNPIDEITNRRGRYSIHLHRTGVDTSTNKAIVSGNVVWGNIGWGITQHHSHADISDNVVYEVTGAGIVSESGGEIGEWNNNLVVDISKGHTSDFYYSALAHNDYLFGGQGLGMRGRTVVCNDNVIADATWGVGVFNLSPVKTGTDRVDPIALSNVREGFQFDQFPLHQSGYSIEGDGIITTEPALILNNTTTIWVNQGLRSIEREMGLNHESRSVFDGYIVWGGVQCLSLTYQADYSFRDVYLSGKDSLTSKGMYLWKHSFNHVFDNIKMVDLEYGVTVSKLVENNDGSLKTRNNGISPWVFLDLITDNVNEMYEISFDDPNTTASYTEHNDNPIHMSKSEFAPRPLAFTILDSTEMVVDVATQDFRFETDGIINDQLGSYDMGIFQAPAQGSLRIGYPQRIYEFASQAKFEEYLTKNGVYKYPGTNDLYFIINEYLPDRLTWEYKPFPIRIDILNAPASGVYATAIEEPQENFNATLQLLSRKAVVSQSSTQPNIIYQDSLIDASAQKAVDGNNNGRIGVNYYQFGLVPIGSFSQTELELEPYFDMDLGALSKIDFIDIWNTVEINGPDLETNSTHFDDFYVMISDEPFTGTTLASSQETSDYTFQKSDPVIKRKFSLDSIEAIGQYIRIQAVGTNMLKFAEIEVLGQEIKDCLLTVHTNKDNGIGSLRSALACAVDGDTISISETLKGDTIMITSTPFEIDKSVSLIAEGNNTFIQNCTTTPFSTIPGKNIIMENFSVFSDQLINEASLKCKGMSFKSKNGVNPISFINQNGGTIEIIGPVEVK